MSVVLVHDYLTQRGGAERVVLSMLKAFPEAPLYTSLFEPTTTFPEFGSADVRPLQLNRVPILRRHHRLALPLLAPAFSRVKLEADVVLCSSSGWAHGVRATGSKVVYCHAPARWLYQSKRYVGDGRLVERLPLELLRGPLRRWDQRSARSADAYLTNSSAVRDRIRDLYGIEADVLPPPPALDPLGPSEQVADLEAGYFLCVSRLLPYKNVGAVAEAFRQLPGERLVVVGTGPDEEPIRRAAATNVRLLGAVPDEKLRWLYANSVALIAASYEDYGLTPLEANAFGRPALALDEGGYLDTVRAGISGLLFSAPTAGEIAGAIKRCTEQRWSPEAIREHAGSFSEQRFIVRLRKAVAAAAGRLESSPAEPADL
jgi:glycosyltransferase involved in cell wall biosynthesis